ncbi:MAG: signal peptidase I [Candidatus Paceibacterota bacterium]
MKTNLNKIGNIAYRVLGILILLVIVFFLISILPIPGGFKSYVVLSGSMEPTIKTGSMIIVKPSEQYKIDDIVTFGPYSKIKPPVTHRIVETRVQNGAIVYITKGDANNSNDTREILGKDIIGKMYLKIPYVGYAVDVAKKPAGFVVLIVIPSAIIIFDEVKKIIVEAKRMKTLRQAQGEKPKEENKIEENV